MEYETDMEMNVLHGWVQAHNKGYTVESTSPYWCVNWFPINPCFSSSYSHTTSFITPDTFISVLAISEIALLFRCVLVYRFQPSRLRYIILLHVSLLLMFWSSSSIYARVIPQGSAFQTEKTFLCPIFVFSGERKLSWKEANPFTRCRTLYTAVLIMFPACLNVQLHWSSSAELVWSWNKAQLFPKHH